MTTRTKLAWLALGLGSAVVCAAADGDLDSEFGNNGQFTIQRPPGEGFGGIPPGDLAVSIDGAYLWLAPLADGDLWVGRSAHDGSADPDFGSSGTGRIVLQTCVDSSPARLVATADGGAVFWTGACLLRVDAQGVVDSLFGGEVAGASGLEAGALREDGQGRYLLAGTRNEVWSVFRFDSGGELDRGFDDDGKVEIPMPSVFGQRGLLDLAVRDDGRIVLAGWRSNSSGANLVVAQLQADGSPDPTWSTDGLVDLAAPGFFSSISASALAIDRDGSVIVSGRGNNGSTHCCLLLARFDQSGALVPGFGLRLFELVGDASLNPFGELREGIALLDNGRILLVTTSFPSLPEHRTQFTLVRALADGSVDGSFGANGWISYTIADPEQAGQAGDYNFLHGFAHDGSTLLLFGRTFFEQNSLNIHYTSFVRVEMAAETIFANGFES